EVPSTQVGVCSRGRVGPDQLGEPYGEPVHDPAVAQREQRGHAGYDLVPDLADELVVDSDIPERSGQRAQAGADRRVMTTCRIAAMDSRDGRPPSLARQPLGTGVAPERRHLRRDVLAGLPGANASVPDWD